MIDQTVRQRERGEASALEVIDTLFAEELTLRENRRVKMALRMAKLSTIKTLAGFDFAFQPSLDRNRILALDRPQRGDPLARSARSQFMMLTRDVIGM